MIRISSFLKCILELIKPNYFRRIWSNVIKTLKNAVGVYNDDTGYRKRFRSSSGQMIYQLHLNDYYICCAFCTRLHRSSCHKYCFTCSKGTYDECSPLLPGTFSFSGSLIDEERSEVTPWILKTPCTEFERLSFKKYFSNFGSLNSSIAIANYETLEGIFLGKSRGKRPCHICASVNLGIYNECSMKGYCSKDKPCNRIIKEISYIYKAVLNMVKYVE